MGSYHEYDETIETTGKQLALHMRKQIEKKIGVNYSKFEPIHVEAYQRDTMETCWIYKVIIETELGNAEVCLECWGVNPYAAMTYQCEGACLQKAIGPGRSVTYGWCHSALRFAGCVCSEMCK